MQTLHQCDCDLSIIIPVYNLERFITPMLESLKGQKTSYNVETIIVLNNCTDNTEQVIRDSGIDCTIIQCTQQGCGCARNAGLDIATGKYIWFLDGDDWLLSDTAVKEVLDRAQGKHNIIYIPFESDTYQWQYFSMVCQYLLKREFIGDIRFPNYQPAEDDAFMKEVLNKAGYTIWNYLRLPRVDNALVYYNYGRPGSNMMRYYAGEKI